MLTGVSLFAGVGGFDLAMQRIGIDVRAAVEIDPKARAVLARRFPETVLFNDVTEVTGDDLRSTGFVPDRGVITGGFPCQDLSVAGRRAGLAGARSGLFWEIVRLVDDLAPRWLVLENVPGLLSSNGGRDMGVVLGALGDLGYGWAYRVLDAQHFGVPQRRRRVFIVAGRRAGAADYAGPCSVLLEPEGVRGDSAPSHPTGQDVAGTLGGGAGSRGWSDDTDRMTFVPVPTGSPSLSLSLSLSRLASVSEMQDVASTVTTGTGQRMDPETESLVVTS
jgi:DNA (cytosine-5)-methyltransferase 1